MPLPLRSIRMRNPGSRGLVSDQESSAETHDWAYTLTNAVINASNRVAARNGWALLTTVGGHSDDTNSIFEFVFDDSTTYVVSAADTAIYSGTGTLTDRSNPASGLTAATADDWQFVQLNGKCYGFQASHTPIVWDPSGVTYDADDFQDLAPGAGTAPNGNAALATHGRIFAFDSDMQTIKWPVLLSDNDWSGAGSGSINLANVWPGGLDVGVALAEWNDYLVVFGERSVVIYSGLDDPGANLALASATRSSAGINDMITGDGLVARDAFVSTGTDLIYLSRSGLRTIRRGLVFDRLPMSSIAPHLQLSLSSDVEDALDTGKPIRMEYHRPLSAVVARIGDKYWYFDVRDMNMVRASRWEGIGWKCARSIGATLYLGQNGGVASYSGYQDGGSSYIFEWLSTWLPITGDTGQIFIPKRLLAYIDAALDQNVSLRWAWDYVGGIQTENRTIEIAAASEFGVAEWGIGEWGTSGPLVVQPFDMSGEGTMLQVGMRTLINSGAFAIQQIDILGKAGRLNR